MSLLRCDERRSASCVSARDRTLNTGMCGVQGEEKVLNGGHIRESIHEREKKYARSGIDVCFSAGQIHAEIGDGRCRSRKQLASRFHLTFGIIADDLSPSLFAGIS